MRHCEIVRVFRSLLLNMQIRFSNRNWILCLKVLTFVILYVRDVLFKYANLKKNLFTSIRVNSITNINNFEPKIRLLINKRIFTVQQ